MNRINMFFLGVMAALGALVFETILSILSPDFFKFNFSSFSFAMLIFILVEEIFKLAVIWKSSQSAASKKEIFLNSILIGVGFGATEIALNFFNQSSVYFLPYFNLALIHIATSLILGYPFSKKSALAGIFLAFLASGLLHFLYNLSILYNFKPFIASGVLILFILSLLFRAFLPNKRN